MAQKVTQVNGNIPAKAAGSAARAAILKLKEPAVAAAKSLLSAADRKGGL